MKANPYRSPAVGDKVRGPTLGTVIAIISFPIVAIPTCVMLYWLVQHFVALYGSPTSSYRPIIGIYGIGLSLLNLIVAIPFAFFAERFGTKADGELALLGMFLIPIPFVLGFFGPFVICWITGSSFGT